LNDNTILMGLQLQIGIPAVPHLYIIKLYPIKSYERIVTIDTQTDLFMLSDNRIFPSSHRYIVNQFRQFVSIFPNMIFEIN